MGLQQPEFGMGDAFSVHPGGGRRARLCKATACQPDKRGVPLQKSTIYRGPPVPSQLLPPARNPTLTVGRSPLAARRSPLGEKEVQGAE